MPNIVIGLLAGASVAAWVYSKFMRRTGGNSKSSVISAAIFGIIAFIVVWTLAITVESLTS